jgi:hypothetical protein
VLEVDAVGMAEEQSGKMVPDMEMHTKQRYVSELLHAEKTAPVDIHQHLLNVRRDQAVVVRTVG